MPLKSTKHSAIAVLSASIALILATTAPEIHAQTGAAPAGDNLSIDTPAVDSMGERVIISDIAIEDSILPTTRPFTGTYGLSLNILDTPRNVTIISREQLNNISIQDVRDFSKLTSSSYTRSNFGAPANPSIRGDSADIMINGMRRGLTSNGNGLPINFNSVESVSITKGPPSVVIGASQYTNGSVDLVTKRPYFDRFQGQASGLIGSYEQYRWTLDFGGPINDTLAYRISYSGEESGSFYENGKRDSQAVYGALSWIPNEQYSLELNAEFYVADYTENFGLNRPTQELIDNLEYNRGFVGDQNGDGKTDNRDVNSGFNFIIPEGPTTIDRRVRNFNPRDGSYGKSFSAQALQTLKINDNFELFNNTFFYYVDRSTESSYYYSEIVRDNFVIANRLEAHINFDIPFGPEPLEMMGKGGKGGKAVQPEPRFSIGNHINTGIELRYQENENYNDFFNEPANAWDLTRSRRQIKYVNQLAGGSVRVPGDNGRFGSPGIFNGDTTVSEAFTLAPFLEHKIDITKYFSLLYGARLDVLFVDFTDPLAPDGLNDSDYTVAGLPNFNVSPTFKPFSWLTTYFTYNYSQSTGVANGGGYAATGGRFSSDYFHRESELFEVGLKTSLLNDKLFLNTAVFHQKRNVPTQGGAAEELKVRGFEFEVYYQPTENFYLFAGYTYLDAVFENTAPFTVQTEAFDELTVPGLTDTFGVIAPLPQGDYESPGVPDHLINGLISYKHQVGPGKLGATLGAVITSQQNLNYGGSIVIPWQYSLDASIFYELKNVEVRFAVLNFTDETNFSPPNPVYGSDSVVVDPGARFEATVRVKW